MVKYCPKCRIESFDNKLFCDKCHTPLYEKTSDVQDKNDINVTDQYYNQVFLETHHRRRKSRMIRVIIIFAVIALIISFSLWVAFFNKSMTTEIAKYYSRNDGPKASLQLSSTGSASPIPDENYYATYGYYIDNNKVGTSTIERIDNSYYNDVDCIVTKTTGDMTMTVLGSSIDFTFETHEYRNQENYMPVYLISEYFYEKPLIFTQTGEINWDLENFEMTYTSINMGKTSTITSYYPEEIIGLFDFWQDLEIGYSDELTYKMDMGIESYSNIDVKLTLSVIGQEDVNVQNGYYENCFIVELIQEYQISGIDQELKISMWINEEGIMPKQEITMPSIGSSTIFSVELDEYYTTVPPNEDIIA